MKIWGLNEAKVIRSIDHPDKITAIIFTYDSHYVITGGEGTQLTRITCI